MEQLNITKLKLTEKYIGGYQDTSGSLRKYKYTFDANGTDKHFFGEIHTKKRNDVWGNSKKWYYWTMDSPMFNTVEELLSTEYEVRGGRKAL